VCLIFVPKNCTSTLQHANVILQHPFKHAFKKEFNYWTCPTIKNQLEQCENSKVDFQMSILKPNLCAWLFHAWEHVKNMDNMIYKRWENTWFLRNFNEIFLLEAIEVNVGTPLFLVNFDYEIKKQEEEDDNIDPKNSMFEIMEQRSKGW